MRRLTVRRGLLALALLCLGLWGLTRARFLLPADPGQTLQQRYGATELRDADGRSLRWIYGPDHTRAQPVPLDAISPR